MAEISGIEAAIHELTREQQKIEQVIKLLRHIQTQGIGNSTNTRSKRRLSAEARKRMSDAAKKRWAAIKSKGKAKA